MTPLEPLRLLLVEDSDDDAQLVLRELRRSGFDVTMKRVETLPALEVALRSTWDIVLSDYTMPMLDAPSALEAVRRDGGDLPFIVISGTIGEQAAVDVMRSGANDYLLKGNLARLGPAVARELRESHVRAEQRRAEAARQEAEASFRIIIESSPDLVVVHRDQRIVYANPKTLERLGYPNPTAIESVLLDAIVIDRGAPKPGPSASAGPGARRVNVEQRWQTREGSMIAVEVVSSNVVFEGAPAEVLIARDVTERNQIAAAMIEMDRMAAIGILAAGVGHEINNPLAYVLANLEFVTSELDVIIAELPRPAFERLAPRITDLRQALADTNHGADRVRAIVEDLRTFSRGEDSGVMSVDVREVLDSSVRMAAVQLRQCATVVKDYEEVPPVLANESRLGQLFLNLLVNAAHAIPEGAPDKNRIELTVRLEDSWVTVAVADTGGGIPPEVLPRIFEPFFTTKPAGRGTGLGLGICRTTVEQMGGDITVTSEVGVGTRFLVRIPRARLSRIPKGRETKSPRIGGRRGHIIVVDEDPALGLALRRALVAEHDVFVITSASEAVERIKNGTRFDVLLCEIMMPGMSGIDLHAEMNALAPDLAERILFLIGAAATPRARAFLDVIPNPRLEKPVALEELRQAIAKMLASY